jgi:ribosomal protein S18 acetylase RimI-like enzyme
MSSEVIDIRQFDAGALSHLLEGEAQAWNVELHWDYSPSRRLVANCLDEKRLAGYVLRNQSNLTGYSFFFYEGEKGLIGNLFVEGVEDRLKRAALLLKHVLETLLATPGLTRVETQLPHFSLEELEPSFRAHAFESYLRRFMILSLARHRRSPYGSGNAASAAAAAQKAALRNFRILPWERRHDRAVAEVIYDAYRRHIDARINDQYSSLAGTTRLVESILQQRGCGDLLPSASLVAIHEPTGKAAAALAVTAVRDRTAHIPQIAVAAEFQNSGLGTALMQVAFQDLSQHGFEEVSLTVTDLNAGAVRLYERMDFETFRTYGAFTWERSPAIP